MLGLRTTIYKVPDLKKAADWYQRVFETKPYFVEPFYVGFSIKGYELGLLPEEGDTAKSDNVMSYWGVEKIDEVYQRFLDAGAISHEKPTNVGGEIMVASVKDPWQNVIGIIYNPEFNKPV